MKNEYLIVEPITQLLRVVDFNEFESKKSHVLSWFTACNSENMTFDECSNCNLCLAGIQEDCLFFDDDFKIIMVMPKNHQFHRRHFKIEMSLLRNEDEIIRSVHIYSSKGNLFTRNKLFELSNRNGGNSTAFQAI